MVVPSVTVAVSRARATRFLWVTIATALLGQTLIAIFHIVVGMGAATSNAIAVLIVAVVGYLLSTGYVWLSDPARRHIEMSAFAVLQLVGLVVSTGVVAVAASISDYSLVANGASAVGFGVVWMLRYRFLDRYVFASSVT